MSAFAIRVSGVSKRYRLERAQSYRALRDVLTDALAAPFRIIKSIGKSGALRPSAREDLWALKDVSLDVRPGEVIGIIGRNGAGKSTLLKVLSRITHPTEGQIEMWGRVGSLLEVGTGFHPELSGRENIFLNGAILGMKRQEVLRKFDEIVAFAEVSRFIDTPVKHYSSGMHMRLAFAVAAHLEPEIFIVDEVLAVGDAAFQKKCMGKMGEVAREGRTVLFVSHSMPAVTRLCRRGLIMSNGQLIFDGSIQEAAGRYLRSDEGTSAQRSWQTSATAPGNSVARLKAIRILANDEVTDTVDIRREVVVEMDYWSLKPDIDLMAVFSFVNDQGTILFVSADFDGSSWRGITRSAGVYRSRCTIPGNLLAEGQVRVIAEISTRAPTYELHVLEHDAAAFQVMETGAPGSARAGWGRDLPGVVRPKLQWQTSRLDEGTDPNVGMSVQ